MTLRANDTPPAGRRPGGSPARGLRPTHPVTLVVAALVSAALGWAAMGRFYGDLPVLTWFAGLTLASLGLVEAVAAHSTRARVERRPGAGRLDPLLVARYAVLAKASSLGGAIFAGGYGGVTAWALSERDRLRVAQADLAPAVVGLVGALALVAGALLLERACRVPPPPDDEDDDTTGTPPAG